MERFTYRGIKPSTRFTEMSLRGAVRVSQSSFYSMPLFEDKEIFKQIHHGLATARER
jgi:hypothetical protein